MAPKIMPSMWKSNDGSLGLLLVNWWNETEQINLTINFEDYGLDRQSIYHLTKMGELNNQPLGQFSDDFNYTIIVPAESLYVIGLSSTLSCGNNPLPEICGNGLDDNCDGGVDEGCSSSSSGSNGGGSSDGVDNDGDKKVDYPADIGCTSKIDNSELDEGVLGTNVTNGTGNPDDPDGGNVLTDKTKDSLKIIIFWTVLAVIVAGVIILLIKLLKYLRVYRKLAVLEKASSRN